MGVKPGIPFLSPAAIAQLHDIMGQGYKTVQEFQDPQELLTIKRRLPSGWTDVGSFRPISIKLLNQQAIGLATGSEIRNAGELKVWEDEFSAAPIKVGDRFNWQNEPCRVKRASVIRFGVATIEFELIDEDV